MFMRQIAYLLALDRHRHFGRAAESCHVSQPALSAAISEMERELGITIVKRNRRFEGITPEGERVIAWARQVQASLQGLRQEAALIRAVSGGHLAIGTIPTAVQAATLLGATCRARVPALTLDIQSLTTSEILRRLQKQDIDFGITFPPQEEAGIFDVMPLYTERYVLLSRPGSALPAELSWAEVAELPLTLLSRDMQSRQMLDAVFAQIGLKVQPIVQSNAIRVLHEEAASGRSFSLLPLAAIPRLAARRDLRLHTIVPEHSASVALMRLRRPQPSALSDLAWQAAAEAGLQSVLDRPLEDPPS